MAGRPTAAAAARRTAVAVRRTAVAERRTAVGVRRTVVVAVRRMAAAGHPIAARDAADRPSPAAGPSDAAAADRSTAGFAQVAGRRTRVAEPAAAGPVPRNGVAGPRDRHRTVR